jgi:hypothetical protein
MRRLTLLLALLAPALSHAASRTLGTLTVDPSKLERLDVPVVFPCKLADLDGTFEGGSLQLTQPGADPTPAQYDPLADLEPSPEAGALVFVLLPQKAPYTVKVREALKLRYRFLVYGGEPDRARNERAASALATPPQVEWRRAR